MQVHQELHGLESGTKVEQKFLKHKQIYNPLILYTNNKEAAGGGRGGGGGGGGGGARFSSLNSAAGRQDAAIKHAVAERNRRKRINTHLNTLRKLFPYLPKRDKPRVLMETVKYLRELREKVAVADRYSGGEGCCIDGCGDGASSFFLPGEKDELSVSFCGGDGDDDGDDDDREEGKRLLMAKAAICCEDRPRLNGELMEAVKSVNGKVFKAEMATVGGRTKAVLVVQLCRSGGGTAAAEEEVGSLKRALMVVVQNRVLGCYTSLGYQYDPVKSCNYTTF